ncbi:uncharacterized protein LOC101742438 isoform X2 [Bombyx mori]|uniref:Uncharacterized protein n=1 Tax=Bombyx mori TaxID=7091 RepID=A0A8R2R537_BOMMO|nr:uncharacterized protein LOC101742438 isoform X3 [Bombyx mori]
MTSTNDGKDVKSIQTSVLKGKTHLIEFYKAIDAGLSNSTELSERVKYLCEAWRQVPYLCLCSVPDTQTHLINWIQRYTARNVFQEEWRTPKSKAEHSKLKESIEITLREVKTSIKNNHGECPQWKRLLSAHGEWFIRNMENPWDQPVLKKQDPITAEEILEWLRDEQAVIFTTRLIQLAASKCEVLALRLISTIMDRVREETTVVPDADEADDSKDKPIPQSTPSIYEDILTKEAGFTKEVWHFLTDLEFVLLHKRNQREQCIKLAKQTPLRGAHKLIERLRYRQKTPAPDKKLWKNASEIATLIAQVVVVRCMVVSRCAGAVRKALYHCSGALVALLGPAAVPAAARALAAPAASAAHLHTLADAHHEQSSEELKPFVCELYVRAITAGMNELEKLKLKTEKEREARSTEQMLALWFVQLSDLLSSSQRMKCECILTAFSVHPSPLMYEKIQAAPTLAPIALDTHEPRVGKDTSEFGSWATDSRSQTNLVKTSETLNLKQSQHQANVLSTAILSEGEALGLSAELCQDISVLLSGPRVKTLSWDMDRDLLLDNCRSYMERTNGGTKALTTELRYLNLDPKAYQHLPEEDDNENDAFYGIEKGYEHLVEFQEDEPEETWQPTTVLYDETYSPYSSNIESDFSVYRRKKKVKPNFESSEEECNPLSIVAETKKKERPHSKERSKERSQNREKSSERHQKTDQQKSKQKSQKKERRKITCADEDPLDITGLIQDQKKEVIVAKQKKKEKRKKKEEKIVPKCSSLSRLVGKRITKVCKPIETYKTASVTDSDYDNQGKCSLNSEGTEEVVFDGLYSMDELRSPENISQTEKIGPSNNEFSIANNINKSISSKPSSIRAIQIHRNMQTSHKIPPSIHNPRPIFKNGPEEVKKSKSVLIEYRKQLNSTYSKVQKSNSTTATTNLNNSLLKPMKAIKQESSFQAQIRPKPVTIPEIPKVFINKNQSQKLNVLNSEVNKILNKTQAPYQSLNNESLLNTQPASVHIESPSYSPAAYRPIYPMKENNVIKNSEHTLPTTYSLPQVSQPTDNTLDNFVKELKVTINAGAGLSNRALTPSHRNINPANRMTPPISATTKSEIKNKCAKQGIQNKSDTEITFSRLSYLHKNKQKVDALIDYQDAILKEYLAPTESNRTSADQINLTEHLRKNSAGLKTEANNLPPNTSMSVLRNVETPKHKYPSNTNSQTSVNNLHTIPRETTTGHSSRYDTYKNLPMVKPDNLTTYPTKTSLSEKDQQDILHILRQQNHLNNFQTVVKKETNSAKGDNHNSELSKNNAAHFSTPSTFLTPSAHLERKIDNFHKTEYQNNNQQTNKKSKILITDMQTIKPPTSVKPMQPNNAPKPARNRSKSNNGNGIKKSPSSVQVTKEYKVKKMDDSNLTGSKVKPSTDWESVMNAIRAQKTPSRGPKALDLGLNRSSSEQAFSNVQRDQGSSTKIKTPDTESKTVNERNSSLKQTTKVNTKSDSIRKLPIDTCTATNPDKKIKTPKMPEPNFRNTSKEVAHQFGSSKKAGVELGAKQFSCSLPKNDDPFISGIENSDYDLIEALMDDDLRQEIGELSSDEEFATSTHAVIKKPQKTYIDKSSSEASTTIVRNSQVVNPHDSSRNANDIKQQIVQMSVIRTNDPSKIYIPSVKGQTTNVPSTVKATNPLKDYTHNARPNLLGNNMANSKLEIPQHENKNGATEHIQKKKTNSHVAPVQQQTAPNVVLLGSNLSYDQYNRVQPQLNIELGLQQDPYINTPKTVYQPAQFKRPVIKPVIISNVPILTNHLPTSTISGQSTSTNTVLLQGNPPKSNTAVSQVSQGTVNQTDYTSNLGNSGSYLVDSIPSNSRKTQPINLHKDSGTSIISGTYSNKSSDKKIHILKSQEKQDILVHSEGLNKLEREQQKPQCRQKTPSATNKKTKCRGAIVESILSPCTPHVQTNSTIKLTETQNMNCLSYPKKISEQDQTHKRILPQSSNNSKVARSNRKETNLDSQTIKGVCSESSLERLVSKRVKKMDELEIKDKIIEIIKINKKRSKAKKVVTANESRPDMSQFAPINNDKETEAARGFIEPRCNPSQSVPVKSMKDTGVISVNDVHADISKSMPAQSVKEIGVLAANEVRSVNPKFVPVNTIKGTEVKPLNDVRSDIPKFASVKTVKETAVIDVKDCPEIPKALPDDTVKQREVKALNDVLLEIPKPVPIKSVEEKRVKASNNIRPDVSKSVSDIPKIISVENIKGTRVKPANDVRLEISKPIPVKNVQEAGATTTYVVHPEIPKAFPIVETTKGIASEVLKGVRPDVSRSILVQSVKETGVIPVKEHPETPKNIPVDTVKCTGVTTANEVCPDISKSIPVMSVRETVMDHELLLNNLETNKEMSQNDTCKTPLKHNGVTTRSKTFQALQSKTDKFDLELACALVDNNIEFNTPKSVESCVSGPIKEQAPANNESESKANELLNNNISIPTFLSSAEQNSITTKTDITCPQQAVVALPPNENVINVGDHLDDNTIDSDCELVEETPTSNETSEINHKQMLPLSKRIINSGNSSSQNAPSSKPEQVKTCNKNIIMTSHTTQNSLLRTKKVIEYIKLMDDDAKEKPNESCNKNCDVNQIKASDIPQSFKDDFKIEHLESDDNDSLKKIIRIKSPNGKTFKATIYGMCLDFDTLFEEPSLRTILLSNLAEKKRYTLNFFQVAREKSNIPIRTTVQEVNVQPISTGKEETIVLSDDDDEEVKVNSFKTEYGQYNVRISDTTLIEKHQKKFDQKCRVDVVRFNFKKYENKSTTDKLNSVNSIKGSTVDSSTNLIPQSSSQTTPVEILTERNKIETHECKQELKQETVENDVFDKKSLDSIDTQSVVTSDWPTSSFPPSPTKSKTVNNSIGNSEHQTHSDLTEMDTFKSNPSTNTTSIGDIDSKSAISQTLLDSKPIENILPDNFDSGKYLTAEIQDSATKKTTSDDLICEPVSVLASPISATEQTVSKLFDLEKSSMQLISSDVDSNCVFDTTTDETIPLSPLISSDRDSPTECILPDYNSINLCSSDNYTIENTNLDFNTLLSDSEASAEMILPDRNPMEFNDNTNITTRKSLNVFGVEDSTNESENSQGGAESMESNLNTLGDNIADRNTSSVQETTKTDDFINLPSNVCEAKILARNVNVNLKCYVKLTKCDKLAKTHENLRIIRNTCYVHLTRCDDVIEKLMRLKSNAGNDPNPRDTGRSSPLMEVFEMIASFQSRVNGEKQQMFQALTSHLCEADWLITKRKLSKLSIHEFSNETRKLCIKSGIIDSQANKKEDVLKTPPFNKNISEDHSMICKLKSVETVIMPETKISPRNLKRKIDQCETHNTKLSKMEEKPISLDKNILPERFTEKIDFTFNEDSPLMSSVQSGSLIESYDKNVEEIILFNEINIDEVDSDRETVCSTNSISLLAEFLGSDDVLEVENTNIKTKMEESKDVPIHNVSPKTLFQSNVLNRSQSTIILDESSLIPEASACTGNVTDATLMRETNYSTPTGTSDIGPLITSSVENIQISKDTVSVFDIAKNGIDENQPIAFDKSYDEFSLRSNLEHESEISVDKDNFNRSNNVYDVKMSEKETSITNTLSIPDIVLDDIKAKDLTEPKNVIQEENPQSDSVAVPIEYEDSTPLENQTTKSNNMSISCISSTGSVVTNCLQVLDKENSINDFSVPSATENNVRDDKTDPSTLYDHDSGNSNPLRDDQLHLDSNRSNVSPNILSQDMEVVVIDVDDRLVDKYNKDNSKYAKISKSCLCSDTEENEILNKSQNENLDKENNIDSMNDKNMQDYTTLKNKDILISQHFRESINCKGCFSDISQLENKDSCKNSKITQNNTHCNTSSTIDVHPVEKEINRNSSVNEEYDMRIRENSTNHKNVLPNNIKNADHNDSDKLKNIVTDVNKQDENSKSASDIGTKNNAPEMEASKSDNAVEFKIKDVENLNDDLVIEGVEYQDPEVGTCYVFSIVGSPNFISENNDKAEESQSDVDNNFKISDTCDSSDIEDLKLIVPKNTYSKRCKTNNEDIDFNDRKNKRNLKRKLDITDVKMKEKRYRKGKNIDYPKFSKFSMLETRYSKEYNNLIDYYRSVQFSYSRPFHIDHINVDLLHQNWPIQSTIKDFGHSIDMNLFNDLEMTNTPDPLNQTLAEELIANYDDVENCTSNEIKETNFKMGFGEESDRVINLGLDFSKFPAATLSDVKQYQPILQSANSIHKNNISTTNIKNEQLEGIKRLTTYIHLKDKVRDYFHKNTFDLNFDNVHHKTFESKHLDWDTKDLLTDLCRPDFFNPFPVEHVVQVVQVGQLPVSTAAQNPVTCDPRVTQVSDASPSQCSMENSPNDDSQSVIKTEYTELTTADLPLSLVHGYSQHNLQHLQHSEMLEADGDISMHTEIKSVVKIELVEELPEEKDESEIPLSNELEVRTIKIENEADYSFESNHVSPKPEPSPSPTAPIYQNDYPPVEQEKESNCITVSKEYNDRYEKKDQIAHAMTAAGIPTSPEPATSPSPDMMPESMCQGSIGSNQTSSNFQKISSVALQQALAQILPPPLNQTNVQENGQQGSNPSIAPQVLHIVKNASGNQLTLVDNTQQSVINTTGSATPVLHIVQNKGPTQANAASAAPTNTFSGLSLVDTGFQQGSNQLLHIVNAGNQNNNTGQLLKRVNLLTNLTNAQGSNEQKIVQFVCKSADGKAIQLNAPHQRGMVLRLQPFDTSNVQSSSAKPTENQDPNQSPASQCSTHINDATSQQEIKTRSVYEENYTQFINNSTTQQTVSESTSLPKFNQAFGKQVFQDETQKQDEITNNNSHLPSMNPENSECQSSENSLNLEHIDQINSPPLLLRKSPARTTQAQPNLVQQIKQTMAPIMHGGVIYTRQIPVNIGGGQTINLITVPSSNAEHEDSNQKQQSEVKFVNQNAEIDSPIIKIVQQNQTATNGDTHQDEHSAHVGANAESSSAPPPQPQPVLTQMRIKLPMLSKNPQMVSGARVVRPSFFQIQRNVIGGANQPVYQQLVLTAAPPLGQQTIRLPQTQTRPVKLPSENPTAESQMSTSTLEQLREFDLVLEQVKERSTGQPNSTSAFSKRHSSTSEASDTPVSTSSESSQQSRYSSTNQTVSAAFTTRKSSVSSSSTASTFARSPDSSGIVDSPSSSHVHVPQPARPETTPTETTAPPKPTKSTTKPRSRPKASSNPPNTLKLPVPPKTSSQKPLEDEQTTQRILYILAEYKEQVENSPDKDKPAPRRRTNLPINASGSKRRKGSFCRRHCMSPIQGEDSCRTMGSEDSSCGTSLGDCTENECIHSPQESPRKVVRRLTFEQDAPLLQQRPQPRNVILADGQTITLARGTAGKPTTAVLMPANYILPVSMVKGGQQIAIVTNRGPKLLTVTGSDGATTNALLLQRLVGPAGLKPVLSRPGVRHVRLPASALHNLQAFNLSTATTVQPPDSTAATSSAPDPPELLDTRATSSPWAERDSQDPKPDSDSSPDGSGPWNLPTSSDPLDYAYEETVRTDNMDRTVLVVHRKDGTHRRLTHVSAAALRHKYAILEHELRLQKSLSEECEDLGVDSPSASELFPEAELLFGSSPAHEHTHDHHTHTPQTTISSSCIPQPDMDDQIATDQLLRPRTHQEQDLGLGLEDVGIVTVSEDGMQATIALDQEEFARSHPNTTFHSEPTEEGEIQPFTIAGFKGRQITSTIFHANRAPATVLMAAPQTTVISQATPDGTGVQNNVKYDIENMIDSLPDHGDNVNIPSVLVKEDGLTRYDNILTDNREIHISNTASAIVHSTGNATQVIRRVRYEEKRERVRDVRYAVDEPEALIAGDDAKMMGEDSSREATLESMPEDMDDDRSSPERHGDLFWETNSERSEGRRPDFSSDSDKCYDETNSTDSSGAGAHVRLHSVIKDARECTALDDAHPPLRTYPAKRPYQPEVSLSGKTRAGERRASARGVVKRGCHCCSGEPFPPRTKKPRPRKPTLDFTAAN